jgi:hypothetical protein
MSGSAQFGAVINAWFDGQWHYAWNGEAALLGLVGDTVAISHYPAGAAGAVLPAPDSTFSLSDAATMAADIATGQTQIATLQTEVASLQTQVDSLQQQIDNMQPPPASLRGGGH